MFSVQILEKLTKMEATFLSEIYEEMQHHVAALRKRREERLAEAPGFRSEPDVFEHDGYKTIERSTNGVENILGTGMMGLCLFI